MARKVTAIPATLTRFSSEPIAEDRVRKVAGYARVSTDHEEQETSYEAQVDYYTNYIKNHDGWEFIKVYTDEGISGTSTAKRTGFLSMITDAYSGKIDLIITKSISRFARNTVDSLTTIRELKKHGVEVYFEKENIWTLDSKSEVLITIMSSIAQEESRSISENVTWGKRKSFADGKVYIQTNGMLGYRKASDGAIEIDDKDAKIIRFIYSSYASGHSMRWIADELTARGIKTAKGKDIWRTTQIRSILMNEKYTGNALLQKTFSVDFLSKKRKVNKGEVPQYYVEDSHPAIISKELFDIVQSMLKDPEGNRRAYKGNIFSGRIICADCGAAFAPKVWHSKDKYKCTIWQCSDKFKGENKCTTPHLKENEIQDIFIKAVNMISPSKAIMIKELEATIDTAFQNTENEKIRAELETELRAISIAIDNLIKGNSSTAQDQDTYNVEYNSLVDKFTAKKKEIEKIEEAIAENNEAKAKMSIYIDSLRKLPTVVTEFSSEMFATLVDRIVVRTKDNVEVVFKNGKTESISISFNRKLS